MKSSGRLSFCVSSLPQAREKSCTINFDLSQRKRETGYSKKKKFFLGDINKLKGSDLTDTSDRVCSSQLNCKTGIHYNLTDLL